MKLKSFFTVLLLVGTGFSVLAPQNPLHSRSAAQLTYQVHVELSQFLRKLRAVFG